VDRCNIGNKKITFFFERTKDRAKNTGYIDYGKRKVRFFFRDIPDEILYRQAELIRHSIGITPTPYIIDG